MKRLTIFFLFILCCLSQSEAQVGPLAIGEWSAIVPYQFGESMVETQKNIIYVSNHGLLSIDKEELNTQFTSKIDGLSNANPKLIAYNEQSQNLMIAFDNSDLDIIVDGRIINAPFIRNSTSIIGSKEIHELVSIDQYIFILTDFGVVKFDILELEVVTTLRTDFAVYNFIEANDRFYMGTENGLFSIDKNSTNLEFSFIDIWDLEMKDNGELIEFVIPSLAAYNGDVLIGTNQGEVIRFDEQNSFDTLYTGTDQRVQFIGKDNQDGYFYILRCREGAPTCSGTREVYHVNANGSRTLLNSGCVDRPTRVIQDEQGRVWLGDNFGDFRWLESIYGDCNKINTNTPRDESVFDVVQTNSGELWLATGGYELRNVGNFSFLDITYMFYEDGSWRSRSWKTDSPLAENNLGVICNMAYDPIRDKIYLASYLDGLLEIDGETQIAYNHIDDNLGFDTGDPTRTKVFDVEVEEDGDVWMSNFRTSAPIRVKRNDGSWEQYTALGRTQLTDLVIDDFGNKWYVDISSTNGLVVFNDNNTSDVTDDQIRTFSSSNSNLTTNEVTFLEKDIDGSIWVGTSVGVFVFDCGFSVFEDICRGFRPIITVDGLPEALLNDEYVTAIDIDGGNRKWFGTNNGIFVHSPDGQVQEFHYNEDNSPLFSNNISTINVDRANGVVYIGTGSGLNVLQTDVKKGGDFHESEITVYPNPVYPDYSGPIAFDGFAQDSDFRITDVSGRLVYRDKTEGGQAVWYGEDLTGDYVKSGVYLIWGATDDINQSDGVVGKVLIISH